MRDTGYYIRNNFIYGPSFGGQFYFVGSYIYGPKNNGRFSVDSSGAIYGPGGQTTGFYVQGSTILGPDLNLPWFS